MPGVIGAMAFTDCYKHMECLGGMRLQSFVTNGYFVYPCNAGYPSCLGGMRLQSFVTNGYFVYPCNAGYSS